MFCVAIRVLDIRKLKMKLIVNKNNTAYIEVDNRTIALQPEYRLDKNTKFNKYIVRDGKAISTAYAIPNKAQSVTLVHDGTSRNANKFAGITTKNLIVKDSYIAKRGHTMKLS
jgi:2-C-methyl-D-erythritol 4-phosphate cytidylyltransferase